MKTFTIKIKLTEEQIMCSFNSATKRYDWMKPKSKINLLALKKEIEEDLNNSLEWFDKWLEEGIDVDLYQDFIEYETNDTFAGDCPNEGM